MTRCMTLLALATFSAIASACAGSQNPNARPDAPRQSRGSSDLITAEELAETRESNVYHAVQRLRPQWLRALPRGQTRISGPESGVIVYIDATRFGSLSSLQSIPLGGIHEIRRYDASEATNRFGTGHVNGAIVIRMTKP